MLINDALIKYGCMECEKQFMLSKPVSDAFEKQGNQVYCPYCKSALVEWLSCCDDDDPILENLG